jgi:putative glutamine amidotransferase
MNKPTIAITTNFRKAKIKNQINDYVTAVEGAGGIPVLIPCDLPEKQYESLRQYEGLILSGGGDVDIRLFNGEPNPAIGDPSPLRDRLELALVKMALTTDWPVFGICRGVQVINIALGGTLYTDIPSQFKTEINHSTPVALGRQYLPHSVGLISGSPLARITGLTTLEVNSFHHQAINLPGKGLNVTARATDGLIEAVELPGRRKPFFGVQWHPENLQKMSPHKALFEEFIRACS